MDLLVLRRCCWTKDNTFTCKENISVHCNPRLAPRPAHIISHHQSTVKVSHRIIWTRHEGLDRGEELLDSREEVGSISLHHHLLTASLQVGHEFCLAAET